MSNDYLALVHLGLDGLGALALLARDHHHFGATLPAREEELGVHGPKTFSGGRRTGILI